MASTFRFQHKKHLKLPIFVSFSRYVVVFLIGLMVITIFFFNLPDNNNESSTTNSSIDCLPIMKREINHTSARILENMASPCVIRSIGKSSILVQRVLAALRSY